MKILLDTGPWVALIDRSESKHGECVEWLKGFRGDIYSTEAVLTEVLYLLNFSFTAQSAALDFVLNSVVFIIPSSLESLTAVKKIMKKYQDFPMDFADATLVSAANDLMIDHIATFDKKHFGSYRLRNKRFFTILP
ncbi:MAG: PIN domain-containing protein [Deltaproteobacteria bacterium]|nr:PIN domain-containing protein [Deltaproteobacteria bacterium]